MVKQNKKKKERNKKVKKRNIKNNSISSQNNHYVVFCFVYLFLLDFLSTCLCLVYIGFKRMSVKEINDGE